MTDSQEPVDQAEPQEGSRRQRRSASRSVFPRVSIQKVLPLLEAIWREGHGEQVRATAAFARMGRSHTSGPSRTLIAAANTGYGLITGNANSPYLSLTDSGKAIVGADNDSERGAAIRNALFENELFRKVYGRYLDKALPSDQVVCDYIKSDAGLSDEDSAACWAVISENLRYSGLLLKEGNRDVVVSSQNVGSASNSTSDPVTSPKPSISEDPNPTIAPQNASAKEDVSYLPSQAEFHFNVQIHLPNDATPEVYDAIFASIAKNLLQRQG